MGRKKVAYAICKCGNGLPKVVDSWDECFKEVNGVKGAVYRGYYSLEDAQWGLLNHCKKKDTGGTIK
jgi:viroplasmin and RNaseH domain-containing protein